MNDHEGDDAHAASAVEAEGTHSRMGVIKGTIVSFMSDNRREPVPWISQGRSGTDRADLVYAGSPDGVVV